MRRNESRTGGAFHPSNNRGQIEKTSGVLLGGNRISIDMESSVFSLLLVVLGIIKSLVLSLIRDIIQFKLGLIGTPLAVRTPVTRIMLLHLRILWRGGVGGICAVFLLQGRYIKIFMFGLLFYMNVRLIIHEYSLNYT